MLRESEKEADAVQEAGEDPFLLRPPFPEDLISVASLLFSEEGCGSGSWCRAASYPAVNDGSNRGKAR